MISIVIPTLNEEQNLKKLLPYLDQVQSGLISEIIISDGDSSDNTIDVASNFDCMICHCSKKGRAYQMNEGAKLAKGSVLFFLHADTFPPPNFDQTIYKAWGHGAGAGSFQLEFDDASWLLSLYSWFTRFKSTLVRFGDQGLFVDPELFRAVGGFDESLVVMEDQEIVRRMKKVSRFQVIDKTVVTSAEKYRRIGIVKLQFIFSIIFLMYYAGARQETMVHLYKSLIGNSADDNR